MATYYYPQPDTSNYFELVSHFILFFILLFYTIIKESYRLAWKCIFNITFITIIYGFVFKTRRRIGEFLSVVLSVVWLLMKFKTKYLFYFYLLTNKPPDMFVLLSGHPTKSLTTKSLLMDIFCLARLSSVLKIIKKTTLFVIRYLYFTT